jgi:hypothetical protein
VVSCSWCGKSVDDIPFDWVIDKTPDRRSHNVHERGIHPLDVHERRVHAQRQYCPECTREHVRAIEAQLDVEFW